MAWLIEFDPDAFEDLKQLDGEIQRRVIRYLRERISTIEDPRRFGKPLRGEYKGLWRYRIGDFRLICAIEEAQFRVRVLRVGHRREVYE